MVEKPVKNMLMIDGDDQILKHWQHGTGALVIDRKDISSKLQESPWPVEYPVTFRSMTKRKEIWKCWETGRPFYYVDNGYMGNLDKKKKYYRVVKNNIQHTKLPLFNGGKKWPNGRFLNLVQTTPYMTYTGRQPDSEREGAILVVTPSEKPCQFYQIDRKTWLEQTLAEIKNHTSRPIIIRDKGLRPDRIKDNSIAGQCRRQRIHSLVTYQSVAALEALHYGIPVFTMAPCCADPFANKDLSKIESAKYPNEEDVVNLFNFLAYCQYTLEEFRSGEALQMIEELKL